MISFKGILKYSIYLFIAGWMFLLGIMVGRGNSPVTFDTQKFQERLQTIASDFGSEKEESKKIELKFYDVLEKPVAEEGVSASKKDIEIVPKKEAAQASGRTEPQAKVSLKKQTYKGKQEVVSVLPQKPAPAVKKQTIKKQAPKKEVPAKKSADPKPSEKITGGEVSGRYTIQVAAYKEFKDAVTQMAMLEKKGFSSYRQKIEKNGTIWYRVRTGSFNTYDDAKKFQARLEKARIRSMIIKKEDHENIKG